MQIWILTTGEMNEAGDIDGVFTSKADAKDCFAHAASHIPFDWDALVEKEDGSIHVMGGCDVVSLFPLTLHGAAGAMQVWTVTTQELGHNFEVVAAFTSVDVAGAAFVQGVADIPSYFDLKRAQQNPDDGSFFVVKGCDWVALTPDMLHGVQAGVGEDVLTAAQRTALT